MLTDDANLANWVAAWACLAGFVLYRHWRYGWGVGLLLIYMFSFAALHWLAPLLHLLPWSEPLRGDLTADGLRQSTFALAGFAVGVELINARRASSARTDGAGGGGSIRSGTIDQVVLWRRSPPVHRGVGRGTSPSHRGDRLDGFDARGRERRSQVLERLAPRTHTGACGCGWRWRPCSRF